MICNAPQDFLSLHTNLQYYLTHKDACDLDTHLNVIEKTSEISNKILDTDILELIYSYAKEYYVGSSRDDQWIKLVKKDVKNLKLEGVAEIIHKIDLLQKNTPKGPKRIDWLKQGVMNIVTVFDQDAFDSNGAMKYDLYGALHSKDNILITSKRCFLCNTSKGRWDEYLKKQDLMMLEQKDSGFLVFIPKNLLVNSGDWKASLKHLDIDPEQLNPVTLEEIYAKGGPQPNIDQWSALWTKSPQLKKRWYFAGHGSSNKNKQARMDEKTFLVALKEPEFKKMIDVVKAQKPEFICFNSCYIGRTIPESQRQLFSDCNFPVVLDGRIDKSTIAIHLDFSLFWLGIHEYLKEYSQSTRTAVALENHLNHYRKELPEFKASDNFALYVNQPALLSPHGKECPFGFKTVTGPHTQNVLTISLTDVRKAQLGQSEIVVPAEKNIVEIYPPVIEIPIRFKEAKIALHSMIPGKAHHFIQKMIFEKGTASDFFDSNVAGYEGSKAPKGIFIESLVTEKEQLKDVCILLGEQDTTISYVDSASGEPKIIRHCFGKVSEKKTTHEERWWTIIQTLFQTMPEFPEVVFDATGGQADAWDLFQKVKDTFKLKGFDPMQLEPVYAFLKALMLNQTNFDYVNQIGRAPKGMQDFMFNLLVEKKRELPLFKQLVEKGYINQNNCRLVKNLPENDRLEIFGILIEQNILTEKEVLETLKLLDYGMWDLFISFFLHQPVLKPSHIKLLYDWFTLPFRDSYKTQLLTVLGRKEFQTIGEIVSIGKALPRSCFSTLTTFVEQALQKCDNPSALLVALIPVMIDRGFLEGWDWIIAYNSKHKLLEELACLAMLKDACFPLLQKPRNFEIVKLLPKVSGLLSPLEIKEVLKQSLNESFTLYVFKSLIDEQLVAAYPEFRPLVIDLLKTLPASDMELMDQLYHFTDEEKNKFHVFVATSMDLLQKFYSWLDYKDDGTKQMTLREAFKTAVGDAELLEKLISCGLDVECNEFASQLEFKLSWTGAWDKLLPFQFYLDHMKKALNQISDKNLALIVEKWNFKKQRCAELLEYAFIERKLNNITTSKILHNTLNEISKILVCADALDESSEKEVGNYEWLAEWLVQRGANMQGITSELLKTVYSTNMIPRLVADGCSLDLIKLFLEPKPQSECKEIYDRILWISATQGRIDLLDYLLQKGCKFTPETVQRALFYADSFPDYVSHAKQALQIS